MGEHREAPELFSTFAKICKITYNKTVFRNHFLFHSEPPSDDVPKHLHLLCAKSCESSVCHNKTVTFNFVVYRCLDIRYFVRMLLCINKVEIDCM